MHQTRLAVDTCDREFIAWHATAPGISGEMVRELMLACIEQVCRYPAIASCHNSTEESALEDVPRGAALLLGQYEGSKCDPETTQWACCSCNCHTELEMRSG